MRRIHFRGLPLRGGNGTAPAESMIFLLALRFCAGVSEVGDAL